METVDNPAARQQNTFPGLGGIESLGMGQRGRYTTVEGLLVAPTIGDLASLVETFRSYNDMTAYILVDTSETTWPNVILDGFNPMKPIRYDEKWKYNRRYTARFQHLT